MVTKLTLFKKTTEDYLSLPTMKEQEQLVIMKVLGITIPPAYWASPNLLLLIIFRMMRNSIRIGESPDTSIAYSWWGITECAILGNIKSGHIFGELGIRIAEKNNRHLQCGLFYSGWVVSNFKEHISTSLDQLNRSYSVALEKGDFEYASYALNNLVQAKFHCGKNLGEQLLEMRQAHKKLSGFKFISSIYWHDIFWQLALDLKNECGGQDGNGYNEAKLLPKHIEANDLSTLFLLYFTKTMKACILQQIPLALEMADKCRQYLHAGIGMFAYSLFHFYDSIVALQSINSNSLGPKPKLMKRVKANQKKIKKWAKHSPSNHLHHWYLINAELKRVKGDNFQAIQSYSKAIEHAHKNKFLHEEALAYELSAKFQFEVKNERFALTDIKKAFNMYSQWGATSKTNQLEQRYNELVPDIGRSEAITICSFSSSKTAKELDVSSIVKASHAIASEIVFDNLITTLLKILMENAGAQSGYIARENFGRFVIDVVGEIQNDEVVATLNRDSQVLASSTTLPLSLLQYVQRTQQPVVMDNAVNEKKFMHEEYFKVHESKSVFCSPIVHQNKIAGLLYLENDLTTGAFTQKRIELVQLLSAQAAISFDNANLYTNLEEKVTERTEELHQSLIMQKKLNKELAASNKKLDEAHDKLHDANRKLRSLADTDALTELANRRRFNESMESEVLRACRDTHPLTLLICDVDHFKAYNDTYGHVEGDECLRKVGRAIKSLFHRSSDLPARYGGEEFAIIIPNFEEDEAAIRAEVLRTTIEDLKIPHKNSSTHEIVTISVGCYSIVPTRGDDAKLIVSRADEALYKAKRSGRNNVVIYSEELPST